MGNDAGRSGQPGQLGTLPAPGGVAEGEDAASGGVGGAGSTPAGQKPATDNEAAGGGGGGAGRIRANATSAFVTATFSPAATSGPLKTLPLP